MTHRPGLAPLLLLLLLLLPLGLALCPAAAEALPSQTWVVSIGNNRGDADEVQLLYAEADAEALSGVLRRLGGVPSNRIVNVLGEDAETARASLAWAIDQIGAVPAGQPSALVVYYSGHADAEALHMDGTRLRFDDLRKLVGAAPATARLLIVDACRSGGVSRVKGARAAKTFELDVIEPTAEGFAIITSSAADETSHESDHLGGSFFSHHLVNGMRGAADRDADGEVTLAEAYGYAYTETLRSSGDTLALQHPTYAWDVKGRGGLVLTRLAGHGARSGTLRLADAVVYVIGDARAGGLVAEVRPSAPDATLSLPPRRYRVQQRRAREYLDYEFELPSGATVALADLPSRAIRYDRLVRKGGGVRSAVHGLTLGLGGRGQILDGEGATPHLLVGYGLDLAALSLGARLRGSTGQVSDPDGRAPRRHDELGLGLILQRFVDVEWASFAFGLSVEGALHRQTFSGAVPIPSREAASLSFGALGAVERRLGGGVSLRLEGGPLTTLLQAGEAALGAEVDAELKSPLTWWVASELVWRL